MQTQQPVWKFLQKHDVVNFVVKTSVAAVVGLISVGGASLSMSSEGTLAHSATGCVTSEHTYTVTSSETWSALAAHFNLSQGTLTKRNQQSSSKQKSCVTNRPQQAEVGTQTAEMLNVAAHIGARPAQKLYLRARAILVSKASKAAIGAQAVENSPIPVPASGAPIGYMAPTGAGGKSNPYPYPACTWWADQRYYQVHGLFVPWTNNAMAWQWNARAAEFGWRVSGWPQVGSILVLQPGIQGAGMYGHVAVVEQVLSNGHVIASSMNWGANPYAVTRAEFTLGGGVAFINQ